MFVACDARPDDELMEVLVVPLLFRVLWLRAGFRRGDKGAGTDFSFKTEEWRRTCP